MQVNMHEAKSQLSKLGERVWNGEEVIIARAGEPYLVLSPYRAPQRRFGLRKGEVEIPPDFNETPEDIIADFEGD